MMGKHDQQREEEGADCELFSSKGAILGRALMAAAPTFALTTAERDAVILQVSGAELKWPEECAKGKSHECTLYGTVEMNGDELVRKDEPEAFSYLQKGCKLGDPVGCNYVGVALKNGWGTAVDLPAARAAFETACDGNVSAGCLYLGGLGGTVDRVRGAQLMDRSCKMGNAKACALIAAAH
jgi:TPR repeat protein